MAEFGRKVLPSGHHPFKMETRVQIPLGSPGFWGRPLRRSEATAEQGVPRHPRRPTPHQEHRSRRKHL